MYARAALKRVRIFERDAGRAKTSSDKSRGVSPPLSHLGPDSPTMPVPRRRLPPTMVREHPSVGGASGVSRHRKQGGEWSPAKLGTPARSSTGGNSRRPTLYLVISQ